MRLPIILMPATEEIVSTSDLQKRTKECLEKAAERPVSVQRPGGHVITMVNRNAWTHNAQAHDWLIRSASIMRYILARARSQKAEPPSDFYWLNVFEVDELRDFTEELLTATQAACSELRPFSDIEAVVKEWHHSALALLDNELQERFKTATEEIKKR